MIGVKKNSIQKKEWKLYKLFLLSAFMFAFFSFFGVYSYKIYNYGYFMLFWAFEILFFLGLRSGKLVLNKEKHRKYIQTSVFKLTKTGKVIIVILNLLCILSFAYFLFLYYRAFGRLLFGTYTAQLFSEEGRTSLEKFTLLLMQLGGDGAYLVVSCDSDFNNRSIKGLSAVCLFLTGLRHLLLGTRFVIAAEFIIFYLSLKKGQGELIRNKFREKRVKLLAGIIAIVLLAAFLYLFSTRSVAYRAVERWMTFRGDMRVKPFWEKIYYSTSGKVDFLYVLSNYLAEAPFIFTSFCTNFFPQTILGGQITFRSVLQIVSNVFYTGYSYANIGNSIASGRYSGFGYILIADFGIYLAPLLAYSIGLLYSKVEVYRYNSRFFSAIYPCLQVICIFAPIFYFNVGRMDYDILFCAVLAPMCLTRKKESVEKIKWENSIRLNLESYE